MSERAGGVGEDEEPRGGNSACWLDRVCPECGTFLDEDVDHSCPVRQSDASAS
jgi:hypothetical protein